MIKGANTDRIEPTTGVDDNKVVVMPRQTQQRIDVLGLNKVCAGRIFGRCQYGKIRRYIENAGGKEGGIDPLDLRREWP